MCFLAYAFHTTYVIVRLLPIAAIQFLNSLLFLSFVHLTAFPILHSGLARTKFIPSYFRVQYLLDLHDPQIISLGMT